MNASTTRPPQQVKKETMYLVGLACLVIGFLGGVVFSVYKTPAGHQHQPPAAEQAGQAAGQGKLSPQQLNTMLSLEREVTKNPEDSKAWIHLGHLYFDSDQYQKAINAYTKALALEPGNSDVWTDLGVMYRRSGQPAKAIEAFDQAIKVNPKHETARFNKGIVQLYDLKDKQGAVKTWQELVRLNPAAVAPNGQLVSEIVAAIGGK